MTDVEKLSKARRAARQAARDGTGRHLRELAGLSQAEIAKAISVTGATISRWESGARTPRGEAAVRYAILLDRLDRSVSAS